MKLAVIIAAIILSLPLYAQYDFSAGMGVNLVNTPSLNDYVVNFRTVDKMKDFNISAEFFLGGAVNISKNWQLGFEYTGAVQSFESKYQGLSGNYSIDYYAHKPSILAFYLIQGEGYTLKFGAGGGYRVFNITEKIHNSKDYTAKGAGLLLKFEGHTLLGGNFYAVLSGSLFQDFSGAAENGNEKLRNEITKEDICFNTFGTGIKIGVSYFIGR
ncbi:MAG: hypothetical protein GXX85_12910 [Ignavibacteria bacterium]|nr:hypothetical protein [Ignavibacteria bacterium]